MFVRKQVCKQLYYIPLTYNVVDLEYSVPTELLAMHSYFP